MKRATTFKNKSNPKADYTSSFPFVGKTILEFRGDTERSDILHFGRGLKKWIIFILFFPFRQKKNLDKKERN